MKTGHTLDWLDVEREMRANPVRGLIACSHGEGSHKNLYSVTTCDESRVRMHFLVEDHGAAVYEGGDIREAIDHYNAAP